MINNLYRILINGKNKTNKLIGIIILEYNSGLETSVSGIKKNPNGNKYFKTNLNTTAYFCISLPTKKAKEIKINVTALKKRNLKSQ
jgi:hypothetical protein